jgi:adenylate cyclase
LCIIALRSANLLLPLTPLLLFPPLALLLLLSAELYRAGSENAGVLTLLSAYLPRQVASRLAAFSRVGNSIDTTVDASRREITVFFADVHGFAGLSEGLPPEVIARLMQRVFSEMAEAVVAHHGTIDKFIGDAIMAFWNALDDDPDHARHALAAAQEIQQRMAALGPFCEELGLAPIRVGIGMETGQALIGNFGSAHRRTFTALGEPVILASRLERLTNNYNEPVLIGETCAAALGQSSLRALGPVQIRGRSQPIALYVPK